MGVIYEISHVTRYAYANPVTLSEHRAMFLPRVGHGGRLLRYALNTSVPSKIRWITDALSNDVALIEFQAPTRELVVSYELKGVHYGMERIEPLLLDARAKCFPVQYTSDEWADLGQAMRPHAEDPDGSVAAWARSFLADAHSETERVLDAIMQAIRDTFTYRAREAEGTQTPGETLQARSGTCRDYAWLMIETLRRLGIACRFISGYLYDSSLDAGSSAMVGSASTHAWLTVYLPGVGWRHYDPTNRINAGFDLIPVAVARHPSQAMPLSGSWYGNAGDFLGMNVQVSIHKVADAPDIL